MDFELSQNVRIIIEASASAASASPASAARFSVNRAAAVPPLAIKSFPPGEELDLFPVELALCECWSA